MESKKRKRSDVLEDDDASLADEDVSRIVVEFQKTHPKIKLETRDDNRIISVRSTHGSGNIS